MIIGIGTDIVENARIARVISRHKGKFLMRLFSKTERKRFNQFNGDERTIGASFAAKEALVKSLGTGFRYGIAFSDIEIIRDRRGKPFVQLSGKADDFARKIGAKHIHLSISHEKSHSVAVVILES
ncbi:MAG: holo-ACP synthase [Candidatus Mycalebacterium zealandia]|nr:MAG: holo-ACP synthase [Candidatus Mycalebacterium zealandia]